MSIKMLSRTSYRSVWSVIGAMAPVGLSWLVCASVVMAQPRPNPRLPGQPGVGQPGAGQPGAGQRNPATKAVPAISAPEAEATKEAAKQELPKGYTPPGQTHPHFLIKEEWDFNPFKDDRDQRINNSKFRSLVSSGVFSSSDDERKKEIRIVQDNIRFRLAQLTQEANRDSIQELRGKFLTDLRINGRKQDSNREVRQEILDTLLREIPELMKYHYIARLNGAILLAELNEYESDGNAQTPAVPLTAATDLLIKVLNDKTQLDSVRLWGVIGLARIASGVPDLKLANRYKIVDALVAQVDASKALSHWFQFRLMDALGSLGTIENQNRELVVPQALGRVMVDAERPLQVRVEAAYSLARLPLNEKIDLKQVVTEVAWMASEGGANFFKQPESTIANDTMLKLYVVFKPVEETEKTRGLITQATAKAQLKKYKTDVDEVFKRVLPVIVATVSRRNEKECQKAVADLNEFLKSNPRQDKSFVDGMPPLRSKSAQVTAKDATAGK